MIPMEVSTTMNRGIGLVSALLFAAASTLVHSAEGVWEFELGAGGCTSNVYTGSAERTVSPLPYAKASYRDGGYTFQASLLDGIGASYFDPELRLLGSVNFAFGNERNEENYTILGKKVAHEDDTRNLLRGSPAASTPVYTELQLGYASPVGILGVSFEYHPTILDDRLHHGVLPGFFYLLPLPLAQRLEVIAMASLGFMDRGYAEAWYEVKAPTKSLPSYKAEAGLREMQFVVQVDYRFAENFRATVLAGTSVLLGDAADSPYTSDPYQVTVGIYTVRTFQ